MENRGKSESSWTGTGYSYFQVGHVVKGGRFYEEKRKSLRMVKL